MIVASNFTCPSPLPAGGTALPTNVEHDRLMGLLAAGLLSGATTAWALKVGLPWWERIFLALPSVGTAQAALPGP